MKLTTKNTKDTENFVAPTRLVVRMRSPENQKGTAPEKLRLSTITLRIIVEDALPITCVGIALCELRARRDTSC